MSSTTNLSNLKYSIAILFSIIIGMTIYIVQKNANQNKVTSLLLLDKEEKNATLKDLEFLKSKYDEVIAENINLSDEVLLEREKVIALIDEIKNNNSSSYYKKKLVDVKSKMFALLDENFKLKQQKNEVVDKKSDTIYTSYEKLYKQNKNLQRQNEDLTNAVRRGASLSVSNLVATSFRAKNSGKLIVTQSAKRANFLKIRYTINENLLSKNEEKIFYTQIVDPNNNVVGETKSIQSSQNELLYTFANKVEYRNKAVEIDQSLPFGSFMKGKYWITIFDFNGVVGKSSFVMK
jgi:hypothetical protein